LAAKTDVLIDINTDGVYLDEQSHSLSIFF